MRPHPKSRSVARIAGTVIAASALSVGFLAAPADAAPDPYRLAERLVRQTSGADANKHLIAFQRASDANGGSRASNTPGYDASVDYVVRKLRSADYLVSTPSYTYNEDVLDAESLTVEGDTYEQDPMTYSPESPEGGATGPIVVIPEDAVNGTGCQADDFDATVQGAVALIRRGACPFAQKATNAEAAGAVAVIISNNTAGPLAGTLGEDYEGEIPVVGISQADGNILAARAGDSATVIYNFTTFERTSRNVIAETRGGRRDNVVMAGAHLDSVPEGAGINDNGSGSAALLDVALKLGGDANVKNRVRFAWWGTEEAGLIGSTRYVAGLGPQQKLNIALYLNFDMVGSPNAAYFVYDGDNSDAVGAGPGPYGSAQIEKTFTDFFPARLMVPTEGTDFTGRSDYGPFIAAGIPSGGLFTGAEGTKTADQAAKWGGTAGVAYDPCYHAACDNLGNVDRVALDRNLDAMGWAVGKYAISTYEVNFENAAKAAKQRAASKVVKQRFLAGDKVA